MRAPPSIARVILAASLLAACGSGNDRRDEPPGLGRAEAALEAGRPGEAGRELAAVPPGSFRNPALRLRAARAHSRRGDWAAAARLLETDAGDFRRASDAALLRTEALLRSGALEEAEKALAVLGIAGPRPERVAVLRAMATVARGGADAGRDLEPLVRGGTRDPDAWVLWAQLVLPDHAEAERRLHGGLEACGDRAPIQRALGRVLLRAGEPGRAVDHLREAARERPSDREARIDLARARVATGREPEMDLALEDLRHLAEDDPADFGTALARAEAAGAKALRKARAAGGNPSAAAKEFEEALRLYEELAARPAPDPATGASVLLGLARIFVETIPLDGIGAELAPGSRLRRAEAALDRALALDPEGRFRDGHGVRLIAENHYLRGRAYKRAHAEGSDHTVAVGWYEKALEADRAHLEAYWDLAMIFYDVLRGPEYVRRAARLAENHLRLRDARGLPPLSPDDWKCFVHMRKLAREGKGFEAGTLTPEPPPEERQPPPAADEPK